ncbi:MAG: 2-amino-4-hydroxy-6-hydroxymethyldihydropteridine diphosphokinase [Anaerolineae bacterium]|jgi:2-amino-4-hydroxy-6-hydroxymethyldihydropteridine diphosphokinase|nr:MAG: 2-amino-4-hydroxy-6-hydroxymethyldihydropteridine diphosphokinase [Anaerolineae bacterium]
MEHLVYISLGSNILPHRHLPKAIELLGQQVRLLAVSSVYETPPVGTHGSNFLNAVVVASTDHTPQQLKDKVLRPLESALGRQRTEDKFAPRTIDLDIIAYDGVVIDQDIFRYAHLAVPLAEILRRYPLKNETRRIQSLAEQFQRQQPFIPVPLLGF